MSVELSRKPGETMKPRPPYKWIVGAGILGAMLGAAIATWIPGVRWWVSLQPYLLLYVLFVFLTVAVLVGACYMTEWLHVTPRRMKVPIVIGLCCSITLVGLGVRDLLGVEDRSRLWGIFAIPVWGLSSIFYLLRYRSLLREIREAASAGGPAAQGEQVR